MGHLAFWLRIAALSLVFTQAQAGTALAQECSTVGQLYSIDGEVTVQRHGSWQRGYSQSVFCAHDAVRTGSLSRAAVMLINEAVLRIDQDSTVYLVDITADEQKRSLLDLTHGAFQSFSRRPRALEVNTPYLNAAVQGTEFVIRAEAGKTSTHNVLKGPLQAAIARQAFRRQRPIGIGLRDGLRIPSCLSARAMPCSGDFITLRSSPFQDQA